ncbi:MAG: hypothetical protein R3F59_15970 [Myxococcota bacterium]
MHPDSDDVPPTADAAEPREPGGDASDPLGDLVKRFLRRGRAELGRAARTGRAQLERRQLQKDLDHFWVRLGKTAFRLVEAGEIDHPSLRQAMQRIEELEAQIDGLRGGASGGGDAGEE